METKRDDIYRFQLSFKGNLLENSVDAYSLANTILATSQALSQIAEIKYGENAKNYIRINIHAFKEGSFISDFLIYASQIGGVTAPLLPQIKNAYAVGKELVSNLKLIIDIKKEMQGKRPTKVLPRNDNHFEIHGNNNKVFVVNVDQLRALQDKTISQDINKIVEPLLKEDSDVKEIGFSENADKLISIDKDDAKFLSVEDELQIIPEIRYKGVVSKIDTKTRSGFLDLPSRRVSFEYPKELSKNQFDLLVDSLRNKIQIYLLGSVDMDLESNPRKIHVNKVERDEKLF